MQFYRPATIGGAVLGGLVVTSGVAAAQGAVADFYHGKTVQLIVPSTMGGSVGLYGKLVADHLGKHIPGTPAVIALSKPGAGGLLAVEFMGSVAPRDGSTIAEVLSPSLLVPLIRKTKFDPGQLQWLGSLTPRPSVVALWHKARATTLEGAKTTELNMGSSGVGSGNYWIPTLSNAVLGTKFKLVTGYRGGAGINLAIERGEVEGRSNYWTGWTTVKPQWIAEKKLLFLFHTGPKASDMPNIPAFVDLASEKDKALVRIMDAPDAVGVGFYAPPGVPAGRLTALRKGFWAMMHDPKFIADAKRLSAPIDPVPAETVQRVVTSIYATPPAVVERLKTIIVPAKKAGAPKKQ